MQEVLIKCLLNDQSIQKNVLKGETSLTMHANSLLSIPARNITASCFRQGIFGLGLFSVMRH